MTGFVGICTRLQEQIDKLTRFDQETGDGETPGRADSLESTLETVLGGGMLDTATDGLERRIDHTPYIEILVTREARS